MNQDLLTRLSAHPFFAAMEEGHLQPLGACLQKRSFKNKDILLEEGRAAQTFYLIVDGEVNITVHGPKEGEIPIQTLHAGDVVGWSWAFPPQQWAFSARAHGPAEVLALDASCLQAQCQKDPELGYLVMKRLAQVMSQRLQATRLRLLDIYANPGDKR